MDSPVVSVIIPIYNVAKYIERCARSLFEQSLQNMEFIFVDDCSPDNSIQILEEVLDDYPSRKSQVSIVCHESNKGLATARNTGLQVASGSYIAHCDSDDWVERNMYERMLTQAIKDNADIVACDFFMEYLSNRTIWCVVDRKDDVVELLKAYISNGWTVCWNLLVKKDLYDLYRIREYDGLNFGEDYGLSVRLFAVSNKYVRLPQALYHYNRTNVASIVRRANDGDNLVRNATTLVNIYTRVEDFLRMRGLYESLVQELSWRMLSGKRGWLFIKEKRSDYRTISPESNRYIDSNPFCSRKDKLCQKIIMKPRLSFLLPVLEFSELILKKIKRVR